MQTKLDGTPTVGYEPRMINYDCKYAVDLLVLEERNEVDFSLLRGEEVAKLHQLDEAPEVLFDHNFHLIEEINKGLVKKLLGFVEDLKRSGYGCLPIYVRQPFLGSELVSLRMEVSTVAGKPDNAFDVLNLLNIRMGKRYDATYYGQGIFLIHRGQ